MADEARGGSGEPGPVHYQISITGRQAAAFFLALLVGLGLAFCFGMKTGSAARRGEASISASNDFPAPGPGPKPSKEESSKPSQATDDRKLGFARVKPEPAEESTKSIKGPTKSEPPRPK